MKIENLNSDIKNGEARLSRITCGFGLLHSAALLLVLLTNGSFLSAKNDIIPQRGLRLPFAFIQNAGQWNRAARFQLRQPGMDVWFADDGITYDLHNHNGDGYVLRQFFINGNQKVFGDGPERSIATFLGRTFGSQSISAARFSEVDYREIYPGISARYYGSAGNLEYDLVIEPNAQLNKVRYSYAGALGMSIGANGALNIQTSVGILREEAPLAYQEIDGKRIVIPVHFSVHGSEVGFSAGNYNPDYSLVIDPTLSLSTYLGGSGDDAGQGIATDAAGNMYVTGITNSTDFPTTTGAYRLALDPVNRSSDIFVAKFDPTGTALLYSTYINASGSDEPAAIKVLSDGSAIIAGTTSSTDFPTTTNALRGVSVGGSDGFVLKLDKTGSALLYATYLGGALDDHIEDLAINNRGEAYVTGWTSSTNFPVTNGVAFSSAAGGTDAFVARLDATGSTLIFSTYLGGTADDRATGIVVEPGGASYITGWTASTDFPTTSGAYSNTLAGGHDAFLIRLRFNGSQLDYSTFIGGTGQDHPTSIAIDSANSPVIAGLTTSSDFPATIASAAGSWFVSKFSWPTGTLAFSRYIGPSDNGHASTIQVSGNGQLFLSGVTNSPGFPLTADHLAAGTRGGFDIAFVRLSSDGVTILHSSVIGGGGDDVPWHESYLTRFNDLYVTGGTASSNFPLSRIAFDSTVNHGATGLTDAFITAFRFEAHTTIAAAVRRDLGQLKCDSVKLDTFFVYNIGDLPLDISQSIFKLGTSEFKILEPTSADVQIAAGDSVRYIVRFLATHPGTFVDTLLISSNDSSRRPLAIAMQGTRSSPFLVAQPLSVHFPTKPHCTNNAFDSTITIANGGDQPAVISSAKFAHFGTFTLINPVSFPQQINPVRTLGFKLRFQPTRAGIYRDTLILTVAGCTNPILIPVEGESDSVGVSIPPTVDFGSLGSCTSTKDTIVFIANTGNIPINIQLASAGGSEFSLLTPLPLPLAPGVRTPIGLRFSATSAGAHNQQIILSVDPCGTADTLNLTAFRAISSVPILSTDSIAIPPFARCGSEVAVIDTSIVVRYSGSDTLTLYPAMPGGSFAVKNTSTIHVVGNDSATLAVRYSSAGTGTDFGTILIPYTVGGCIDTLRLQLSGSTIHAVPFPTDTVLTVAELAECRDADTATAILRNPSNVPLTIDSTNSTSGALHLRPTLPFIIPAGGTIPVLMRFSPRTTGAVSETVTYFTANCRDSSRIIINGSKLGAVISFDERSIDFQPIFSCALPYSAVTGAALRNGGSGTSNVTIASANISGSSVFSLDTDFSGSALPSGSAVIIPIHFVPSAAGNYSGELRVVISPCNDTITIPLSGRVDVPTLAVRGGTFGSTVVGVPVNGQFSLVNTTSQTVRIMSIPGLIPPFAVSTPIQFPLILSPGDSVVIPVVFNPENPGNYSVTPVAVADSSCTFSTTIELSGIATVSDALRFCLSGEQSGIVGDSVTAIISGPTDPELTGIDSVYFVIQYDWKRLELLGIEPSNHIKIIDRGIGIGTVIFTERIAAGVLLPRIQYRLLAGVEQESMARLDSVVLFPNINAAVLCKDSFRVHISDRCITGVTLGKFANRMEQIHPNPAGAKVTITYQQLEDARTTFSVYDLTGHELLRPLDAFLKGGRYTIEFDARELASGTYVCQIHAGSYSETGKLIIAR